MPRSTILFLIVLILAGAAFIGGCRRAGQWLVKDDVPRHSDAIVLLMGSFPERVLETADLYHESKAGRMLIVYESMGPYKLLASRGATVLRTTQQAHDAAVALGIPADSIFMLPGEARSTLDEAMVVRNYIMNSPVADTLLLVSSPAHMRRASMIFKAAFSNSEAPVYIGCSPSAYSDFDPEHWWRRKEDIQSVLSEFLKIGSFIMFEKKALKTGKQQKN